MMLRRIIHKIHLWLSLLAGVFIVLIGLTGSILVFNGEINRALHPDLFHVTAGAAISYDKASQAVLENHPNRKIERIYAPAHPDAGGVYLFRVKDGKERNYVYVDPGTGKITGELGNNTFLNWVGELHYHLLLADYNGSEIVGIIGFMLFFVVISGIYLWWPGIKNWVKGFSIRKSSNRYIKHYDYHKVFGIVSVPFLLIVSLTGALFTFDEDIFGWFGANPRPVPSKELLVSQPLPTGKLPLDQLVAFAQQTVPDARVTQIRIPAKPEEGKPEGAMEVRLTHHYDPSGFGNVQIWLDQYSGKVIAKQDATVDPGLTYQTWLFPLHTGMYGGIITKVIYCIGGLIPALLMVTGTYMWYRKARKKQLAKQKVKVKTAEQNLIETA